MSDQQTCSIAMTYRTKQLLAHTVIIIIINYIIEIFMWHTMGHFSFCISPFAQQNHYLYSQASRNNYNG